MRRFAIRLFVILWPTLGLVSSAVAGLVVSPGGIASSTSITDAADPPAVLYYSDPTGNKAIVNLQTIPSGLGDGSYLATSGTLWVTQSASSNVAVGTYTLLPAGPGITVSPSGLFFVDNLLYPKNNAASGVQAGGLSGNPSFLTNDGLLFGQPGTGSQTEVNIWGNGAGDYAFFTVAAGNYNIQTGNGGSVISLFGVPEPSGVAIWTLVGLGLICAGAHQRYRRRLALAVSSA